MSKITNLQEVYAEAAAQVATVEWSILDYVSAPLAAMMVANIYNTCDLLKGFGQDVPDCISVISSPKRISVIVNGHSSFYQETETICGYEILDLDINQILICLQAALERLESQI